MSLIPACEVCYVDQCGDERRCEDPATTFLYNEARGQYALVCEWHRSQALEKGHGEAFRYAPPTPFTEYPSTILNQIVNSMWEEIKTDRETIRRLTGRIDVNATRMATLAVILTERRKTHVPEAEDPA